MDDGFIGEIRIFVGNFAPRGWNYCDGQLLPIAQNTALFSVIGTTYGGDGIRTFALPDLRDAAALQQGRGPGLTSRDLGESGGQASVTLQSSQMPTHTHVPACTTASTQTNPKGGFWATASGRGNNLYADAAPNAPMSELGVGIAGGTQPHNNLQPYLGMPFIICVEGMYPAPS